MIDPFAFLRGPIRHMKLIGQAEEHKALRARNEARLAALKAANRLYEDKRERPANHESSRANLARNLTDAERAAIARDQQRYYNSASASASAAQLAGNGYAPVGNAFTNVLGISSAYFGADSQR